MHSLPYDRPLDTPDARAYRQQLEAVYRDLVAAGVVRPGERQTVDVSFLEQVFSVTGRHEGAEAAAVLRELRDDLDLDGRAEITPALLEHLEEVAMAIVADEVTAEMAEAIPDDAPAHVRGFYLFLAGRDREALAAFTEAIASGEAGLYPYWDRGRVLQSMGRLRPALADFDRYLASPCAYRRPTAWSWRAQVLTELGHMAEAVASMAQAVADLAEHPAVHPGAPPDPAAEEADDRRSHWVNELQVVINTVQQLDGSSRLTPNLRPALEAVKADIVRLRQEQGI